MKLFLVIASLLVVLAGCANSGQPMKGSHQPATGLMGESVREVSAYGFVTQVSAEERVISIKHAPIPEMNWAPMVMGFSVADNVDLTPYKRGDKVQFVLEVDQELNYRIKEISQ